MRIEVRRWGNKGDKWPDKRISLADKDSNQAFFISSRYADLDEAQEIGELIAHQLDIFDDMYDALDRAWNILAGINDDPSVTNLYKIHYDLDDLQVIFNALKKVKGEV